MEPPNGYRVVLTADRSLMAGFRLLFDGILPAAQTTTIPSALIRALLLPKAPTDGLRARVAPLGLRRIEAALVRDGFGRDDVAVVHPNDLDRAIGADTRVVGVSTGEPTGLGMNTTTMTAIAGGRAFPAVMFRSLMTRIRRRIERSGANARVVVGGPGAWQLTGQPETRRELGIHHVVDGHAEGNVGRLFRSLIEGEPAPDVLPGDGVSADRVPGMLGASTMGIIEISRGCGLGCPFCSVSKTPMGHLSEDAVLADAEMVLATGQRNLCAIGEDIFRYGADGLRAKPDALLSLLRRLRALPDVRLIQTDHGNIASIAQFSDAQLREIRDLMVGPTGQQMPWVNVGIETASGRLLRATGCGAKMGPYRADEWADVCTEQLGRLQRAGFFPIASLIAGLPGETDDDTRRTLAWVESLLGERLTIFPLLHAPIDGSRPFSVQDVTPLQWRLIRACYRLNFRWIPKMHWDNQRAGGTPFARRLVMRILATGEIVLWKGLLAWRSRRSRRADRR